MRPSTHGAAPRLTVAARSHLEATHLEQRERRVRKVIEVAELRVDPDARALVARLAVNVSSATLSAPQDRVVGAIRELPHEELHAEDTEDEQADHLHG